MGTNLGTLRVRPAPERRPRHAASVQYEVPTVWGVTVTAKISDQYRYALSFVFRRFPNSPKVILLEEDLIVASDFFSYFNQTAWLLDPDTSLCCVSAWTDLGGLHTAHNPRLLLRVEVLPGLGWMVGRSTALHLLSMWMSPDQVRDGTMTGIYGCGNLMSSSGGGSIMPDVSRTFHIGFMGSHAAGFLHTAFFAYKSVPVLPYVPLLNVHRCEAYGFHFTRPQESLPTPTSAVLASAYQIVVPYHE
ncbi:hypothetical protein O3P69_008307 [Scylla paramamosain]|uniref:Alpha-1,3-mannosyl-glycoprotein 2-beta-N-acetylglucosaminyltransferase n=1 Tax=Scylla paramamosain TaxID=85552 RepID=A0AAW0SKT2_SCYPA